MGKIINLTGQRYGRLVAIELRPYLSNQRKAIWKCVCDCGNEVDVISNALRTGNTRSCGCFKTEETITRNERHGLTHTRIYGIWQDIKARCENKHNKSWNDYGGRGITICKEWRDNPKAFYEWAVANGYRDDLSIDRMDVNGPYSPDNCRWADEKTQARNQRPKKNKTGHAGASKVKGANRFQAAIILDDGERHYLGCFKTAAEAGAAYQRAKAERDQKQG